MMAEVGGMVNVNGSRIATPFAPPRPGSTPMMMPSTMPTIISNRLNGDRTTAKPWNSALSSTKMPPGRSVAAPTVSVSSRGTTSGSSVPLNSGTLNQTSNIRKRQTVTTRPIAALFHQE